MTKNFWLKLWIAFIATILPGTPLVGSANARQCSDLTEYVDMWDDGDEMNETVGLFARGVAEAGEGPCDLTVRTYIQGPDNTELTSAYGYGSHIASSTVVVYLDETSDQGNYTGKSEAWSGSTHYGCSQFAVLVSIVNANYIKSFESQSFCGYLRCDSGHCQQLSGKKTAFSNGVCTAFYRISSVRLNYVVFAMCLARPQFPIPSCSGEENASAAELNTASRSELCLSKAGILIPRGE